MGIPEEQRTRQTLSWRKGYRTRESQLIIFLLVTSQHLPPLTFGILGISSLKWHFSLFYILLITSCQPLRKIPLWGMEEGHFLDRWVERMISIFKIKCKADPEECFSQKFSCQWQGKLSCRWCKERSVAAALRDGVTWILWGNQHSLHSHCPKFPSCWQKVIRLWGRWLKNVCLHRGLD